MKPDLKQIRSNQIKKMIIKEIAHDLYYNFRFAYGHEIESLEKEYHLKFLNMLTKKSIHLINDKDETETLINTTFFLFIYNNSEEIKREIEKIKKNNER